MYQFDRKCLYHYALTFDIAATWVIRIAVYLGGEEDIYNLDISS